MKTIGIIGGGQLGRMLAFAAHNLGFKIFIYSDELGAPATFVTNNCTIGSYDDEVKLSEFAKNVDILTFEFENVNCETLKRIESTYPDKLFPNSNALYISNNRLREKHFLRGLGVKIADFFEVKNFEDIRKIVLETGLSYILKTAEDGYDGKGQFSIQNAFNLAEIEDLVDFSRGYVLERVVDFKKEASLIMVRGRDGVVDFFPIPENVHRDGILRTSSVPNSLSKDTNEKIRLIGEKIAAALDYVGVMAVEFFIDKNEDVIVNEIAPRVHNSGHFSLDSCNISQFEAHIRAICGLPMKGIELFSSCKMRNLIGDEVEFIDEFLNMDCAYPCIYGKSDIKEGRKMGHVNILKPKIAEIDKEFDSDVWNHGLLDSLIKNKE